MTFSCYWKFANGISVRRKSAICIGMDMDRDMDVDGYSILSPIFFSPTCLVCGLSWALCGWYQCHALYNNNNVGVHVLLHLEMYHRRPFPWPQ